MSPFAQTLYEIALEALITTQSVRVHITRFDPISDEAYQVAWTHVPGGRIQQAMELLRGKVRGFLPNRVTVDPDRNSHVQAVYRKGEVTVTPLEQAAAGVAPELVLNIAKAVTGMRWVTTCPAKVDGVVVGAITFIGKEKPDELLVKASGEFAERVAIALTEPQPE